MKCKNCKTKIEANQKFCPECGTEIKCKKLSKKARAIIALACCLAIVISGTIGALHFYKKIGESITDADSNYVALKAGFTDVKVTDEKSAVEAAASVSDVLGINNAAEELKNVSVNAVDGDNYYRLQQYYNGIPVYGRNVTVAADKGGTVNALTSNFDRIDGKIDLEPTATQEDIEKSVRKYLNVDEVEIQQAGKENLVIYNLENTKAALAYNLSVGEINSVIVDAKTAEVLLYKSAINNVSADVQSEDGTVKSIGWKNDDGSYHLYNDEHKIEVFDVNGINTVLDDNGDGKIDDKDKGTVHTDFKEYGIDTMYSKSNKFEKNAVILLNEIIELSEYYKNFGFEDFERIHAAINDNYNNGENARGGGGLWEGVKGAIILIGNKFDYSCKGVMAHEYTHAVTDLIVGWCRNSLENSALIEAYSDIFGALYENSGNPDWKIEHLSEVERDLTDPSKTNGYDNMSDLNEQDSYNEYTLSTIISHSAYLMWNGIDGQDNRKINSATLGKIWYGSMNLLQPNADFKQCRNAVELSARIMLRNKEITQEQYKTVISAFEETGIEHAAYTFSKTVKNSFDISVLNSNGTENVNYMLEVIQMPKFKSGHGIKNNQMPKTIMEKTAFEGKQNLDLEDGAYLFRITDVSDESNISQIINVKILVDGKSEFAMDKVVINTDFSDITTAALNKEDKDENLATLPGKYVFTAGVGAWSTELNINEDFTFSGTYHDSEAGITGEENPNGTVMICEFTGNFSSPEKIDEYTYKLSVESLSLKQKAGYVYYNDGIKYECVGEPYGLDGSKEFYFYIKGRQTSDLSEDFLSRNWIYEYDESSGVLPCNCIRNPQTDACFAKSAETDDAKDIQKESTTAEESTTNNIGKFYGNQTAEQLRKSIIGSWGAEGSFAPEYNFIDSENCTGTYPWQSSGTYTIDNAKTLTISWAGKSEPEVYVWSEKTWDEFYSDHDHDIYFWYMTDKGIIKINGEEKYREGIDRFTYNTDGDLLPKISGLWINDNGHYEYLINSDGTWVENAVVVYDETLINRTELANGKVEIIDDTTAKLWNEVKYSSELPFASELVYDKETDSFYLDSVNDAYSRAKYK